MRNWLLSIGDSGLLSSAMTVDIANWDWARGEGENEAIRPSNRLPLTKFNCLCGPPNGVVQCNGVESNLFNLWSRRTAFSHVFKSVFWQVTVFLLLPKLIMWQTRRCQTKGVLLYGHDSNFGWRNCSTCYYITSCVCNFMFFQLFKKKYVYEIRYLKF